MSHMTDALETMPDLADLFGTDEMIDRRLAKDVKAAAKLMSREDAILLVDRYYALQEHRIALGNQASAATREGRSHEIPDYFGSYFRILENQMKTLLDAFTENQAPGRWAKAQLGIGPVLAAGFLAHIDITRAPTVGHIWSFAGLDPTKKWGKGQKRPWNARLKTHCWKTGDSFVKVSGREDSMYGQLYRSRKEYEVTRDLRGDNAEIAAETLKIKKIEEPKTLKIYQSGHLPPGRLDLRARRWAVKIFLAHLHHVMYLDHYGVEPPRPYVLEHVNGHVHKILCPAGGDFAGEIHAT